jgi:hypothetical protein
MYIQSDPVLGQNFPNFEVFPKKWGAQKLSKTCGKNDFYDKKITVLMTHKPRLINKTHKPRLNIKTKISHSFLFFNKKICDFHVILLFFSQ